MHPIGIVILIAFIAYIALAMIAGLVHDRPWLKRRRSK